MDIFTREDLRSLLAVQDAHCLTIALPADANNPQAAPILLKNLQREAARLLGTRGLKAQEVSQFLEPVEALASDPLYWREQAGGLAIFRAGDFFKTYRVPMALNERVSVRDHFILSPLIPLLAGDGRFHVLAISQKQVRLMEGSRANIAEVTLAGMPTTMAEVLKDEEIEKEGQFRTHQSSAGRQRGAAVSYGSGPEEDDKSRVERFFREVDKGVQKALRREFTPLVLAGVDFLLPIYRSVNTYPQLVEGGVTGSPDALRPSDLHQKAWALVSPIFERDQQAAVAQFEQYAKTERASDDLHEIVPAAHYGRVETLLVARGVRQPGTFNPETGKVVIHKTAHLDAGDVLDLAAIQTLMHDGSVYALAPGDMPGGARLAAVFRY